ncbi:hypothetical protein VNO78_03840 [Psophocarpus tetragonolobus]|uniref:Uncharacterized protein n=1 Tax=Psophocarpus tetragonolobus TaxID=3891 RepID=A0AAN9T1Q5_PSOTE
MPMGAWVTLFKEVFCGLRLNSGNNAELWGPKGGSGKVRHSRRSPLLVRDSLRHTPPTHSRKSTQRLTTGVREHTVTHPVSPRVLRRELRRTPPLTTARLRPTYGCAATHHRIRVRSATHHLPLSEPLPRRTTISLRLFLSIGIGAGRVEHKGFDVNKETLNPIRNPSEDDGGALH